MNPLLLNTLFFSLSLLAGIVMIVEGCLIVLYKKQITPLPVRVLAKLGLPARGQPVAGRTSPKSLRTYAKTVLVFGPLIVISSFVYLFTVIL